MPRKKKHHRGVRVTDVNIGGGAADEESLAMGPSSSSGGYYHHANGLSRAPPIACSATDARYHHRPHFQRFPPKPVDSATLRRAFMLQKFQFILRRDLLSLSSAHGVAQGHRKLIESVESSDVLVPWTAVHSVVMRATREEFECPICLDRPTAPRITDCGHIFCLPCILHYLYEQKKSDHPRTCPVCDSIIGAHMLRPCVLHCVAPIEVGHEARFDLFRREHGSCILRRYDDPRREDNPPSRSDNHSGVDLIVERLHLPRYLDAWGSQSRYVFSTEEWEMHQRMHDASDLSAQLTEVESMDRPLPEYYGLHERFLLDGLSEVTKEHKILSTTLTRESPPLAPKSGVDRNEGKVYQLYADGEGRSYFLHMLTARMIKHDAELRGVPLPDSVAGVVQEVTSFVQDEDSRHVYKVFAHVPLHSTVHLCILDLSGVVSQATLDAFQPQLDERARQRRVREETETRNAGQDRSWEDYLEKYRAVGVVAGRDASPIVNSEFSYDRDSMPMLQLPSAGGEESEDDRGLLPNPLETRQRATKRQFHDPSAHLLQPTLTSADLVHAPGVLTSSALAAGTGIAPSSTPSRGPPSVNSCWTTDSASRLFKTQSGGHAFQNKK